MTIDKAKLKDLAQAVAELEDIPERQDEHAEAVAYLETHMHCHTILALLAEIERLESAKGDPVGSFDKHMEYMQENIRLKAENEDYKSGQERYEQIIEDLKAENEALRKIISESSAACGAAVSVECSLEFMAMLPSEIGTVLTALRKDAERWKFFKELSCQIQAFPHAWGQMTPEKMDFMCDEAMAKEAGHG